MIHIEDQVCSPGLAQRLKELGARQNSYFWWKNYSLTAYGWSKEDWHLSDHDYGEELAQSNGYCRDIPKEADIYSAFAVAELMQMLPRYILHIGKTYFLEIMIDEIPDPKYRIFYRFYVNFLDGKICQNNNIAEAAAELLALAIENGYVKAGDL